MPAACIYQFLDTILSKIIGLCRFLVKLAIVIEFIDFFYIEGESKQGRVKYQTLPAGEEYIVCIAN